MVPYAQPSRALHLFSSFVGGKRLPNTTRLSVGEWYIYEWKNGTMNMPTICRTYDSNKFYSPIDSYSICRFYSLKICSGEKENNQGVCLCKPFLIKKLYGKEIYIRKWKHFKKSTFSMQIILQK